MSAPNGGGTATLDQLRIMGRATSLQLARSLCVGADVVLSRLCKLESAGRVARIGTVPGAGRRPAIVWAPVLGDGSVRGSIPASDSVEFEARGGIVEQLPGFNPVPPALRPVRQVYRGKGGL